MLTEPGTRNDPVVSVLSDRATIAVLGLGSVGLPVAQTCAEAGFRVAGIDSDPERVRGLREADKDGPEVFPLSSAVRAGNLAVTDDAAGLAHIHAVFTCVPTPQEEGAGGHRVAVDAASLPHRGRAKGAPLRWPEGAFDANARRPRAAAAAVLLVPPPGAVLAALVAFGPTLFDASGTLPGAVGI